MKRGFLKKKQTSKPFDDVSLCKQKLPRERTTNIYVLYGQVAILPSYSVEDILLIQTIHN